MGKKHLLLVSHIPSKNTAQLKDAVLEGAYSSELKNIEINFRTPFDAQPSDVIQADAIIMGTTENLGYMSGALKDFFDRCYYPVLEEKQGLPCAAYIRAGHDGTGTLRALKTITTGLRWRWVQEPIILKGDFKDAFLNDCRDLGCAMAVALDEGII